MMSASSSIKLVNVTDNYVVFVTRCPVANVAEYESRTNIILPPRSTHEFLVRRTAKKSVVQSIECDDKYILFSTTVSESFSNSEYGSDIDKFYDKQGGQIWCRRELTVVLEQPHTEISSSAPEELIQVDPSELRFPFLTNEMLSASSSVKVVNITENYVVLVTRHMNTNVAEYTPHPNGGILPPKSTHEFLVTRTTKKSVDKYILYSTTVNKTFSNSNYGSDLDKFYDEEDGQIWHIRELAVVLEPAYRQGPPYGMPHTKISSSVPEELIQVDPSELRFPFLPNEMLSASSSIKVVNVTDNYVVFITRSPVANVAWYPTRPYGSILPPRSTQELFVRRTAKKSVAQSIECDDKYIFYSTTVSESFSNSQYGSDLDKFYSMA